MENKKINIDVDHSDPGFFAMDFSVSFNQMKFTLDYTKTIQRVDPLPNEMKQSFSIKHRTILMDPLIAKNLARILNEMVEKYEKKFGKIKIPKSMKKKTKKIKAGKVEKFPGGNVYIG